MSPTLIEGDVVAWTPTKIEDIKTGDVVVFKSYVHWPDEKILVHRVSNIITNSKGEIRLETKGDNNKWTDQAGPHIPEPYIREENLMGKILSIGQQPLKIPFIGFLGLWINQGLDSLSQPTSSKDPISYAGIFAPLTISIVILVILIFILPEKAKTIKEKIHLNIFGRKPLKLKRTIITFLIAYIIFLTVIHTFANDSISASVGINADDPGGAIEFGRIKPGRESFPKDIPLINPGTMHIKGIIFGRGEISEYIPRQTFELERGETKSTSVKAVASNETQNGSYVGEIMLYSSPFWIIFPDDFIQNLINLNAEATVFILDLLSAIILTTITLFLLISITFVGDKIVIWAVDRSWRHPSRLILKENVVKRVTRAKENTKRTIGRNFIWIARINFSDIKLKETVFSSTGKPILAALVIIPILYFLEDQILAMFIAVLIAGLLAYLISCKIRSKIVLAVLTTMVLAIAHMIIQSNLVIISKEQTMMELMALTLGTIGIYLLLLAVLLIPLSLVSWSIVHLIQNVKERKDPLLSLEGSCDL